jgi:hypothetical protein
VILVRMLQLALAKHFFQLIGRSRPVSMVKQRN